MMRQFLLMVLFSAISLLCVNGTAKSEPVLGWHIEQQGSGFLGATLILSGGIPANTEIVFNEITFEDVHNVYSNMVFVDQYDTTVFYKCNLPQDIEDLWNGGMINLLNCLPEYAKHDAFLLTPLYGYNTNLRVTETNVFPSETNDATNPMGLDLYGNQIAGIGDLSGSYTVTSNITRNGLIFAYVPNVLGNVVTRPYVSLDVTIGENNYRWQHQPIGWIEWAVPRFETDPADGKLNFGNVRIGTTLAKDVTIFFPEDEECIPWTSGFDSIGDFQQTNYTNFLYAPTGHGQDQEWLGDEYWCSGSGNGVSIYFDCTGRGVGPIFESEIAVGETIDFGEVAVDSFVDVFFEIGNVTSDEELGDLTCLSFRAEIVGDDATLFEIVGDSEGTLLVGESTSLQLRFNGQGLAQLGDYDANLIIYTDEGTEFGNTSIPQTFAMAATAVPEPSMLIALLGLGMTGLLIRKSQRR